MAAAVTAGFHLRGDFNPDEVTKVTGLQPTDISIAGHGRSPNSRIVPKNSGWTTDVHSAEAWEIEATTRALLARLRPNWPDFVRLGKRHEAVVSITVEPNESMPALYLPQDILSGFAELNAGLDVAIHADLTRG